MIKSEEKALYLKSIKSIENKENTSLLPRRLYGRKRKKWLYFPVINIWAPVTASIRANL